ncbi:MAG: acyl-CoA dehydrogenase family protein [Gemmataceae bacterium]
MDAALLSRLAELADAADTRFDWPAASLDLVRRAGLASTGTPARFGGRELSAIEQLSTAEQIASACLTTAFILSQREAAVRRIASAPNKALGEHFLPRLARGECYLTVGLSQLTTSRQHGGPALLVEPISDGYQLTGEVPWVTGADQAEAIVIGGRLADGRQALFLVPTSEPGVFVRPPMDLAALKGSRTSSIRLDQVKLKTECLLNGPAEKVLTGPGGGGLETSALALGLAGAAIADMHDEAVVRPDLKSVADEFAASHHKARQRLHELASMPALPDTIVDARVECTRLALRATQAHLTAAKGAGFVAPHPAQRRARQALFFLVWSCPRPAAEGLLAELVE